MPRGAAAAGADFFERIFKFFRLILFVILAGAVALYFFASPILKWAITSYGEKATGAQVTLAGVEFNPLAGRLALQDFYLYNPIGFTNAPAVYVKSVTVRLLPQSLLSNHIVIEDIVVENPEILFEGGIKRSNLSVLKQNLQDYVSANLPQTETVSENPDAKVKEPQKYSIDRLMITNPVVRLSTQVVDKQVTVQMQDIVMKDIGKGGTDAATLYASILQPFMGIVNQSVGGHVGALAERVKGGAKDIGSAINDFFRGDRQ